MLRIISQNADCNPAKSLNLVQLSYSISRSDNRNIIKREDAERAVGLLKHKKGYEPHS